MVLFGYNSNHQTESTVYHIRQEDFNQKNVPVFPNTFRMYHTFVL